MSRNTNLTHYIRNNYIHIIFRTFRRQTLFLFGLPGCKAFYSFSNRMCSYRFYKIIIRTCIYHLFFKFSIVHRRNKKDKRLFSKRSCYMFKHFNTICIRHKCIHKYGIKMLRIKKRHYTHTVFFCKYHIKAV